MATSMYDKDKLTQQEIAEIYGADEAFDDSSHSYGLDDLEERILRYVDSLSTDEREALLSDLARIAEG